MRQHTPSADPSRGGPPLRLSQTVHGVVAVQAEARPGATAVRHAGRTVTYRELDRWSDRVAAALARRGVGPGQVVAVAMDRSAAMVAAFLGVLKAGAAYCPLDLQDPPARRAVMLADARPTVTLTTGQHRPAFADPAVGQCLCLEDVGDVPTHGTGPVAVSGESPAALMYTSGSTGRPKGTVVPHRGILRLLLGNDYATFGPGLRTLFHSPPHFDASTFEVWGPLFHGGTCGVYPGERIPSLPGLAAAVADLGVTALFLGPALFNLVVDEHPQLLAGLREVLVGGEVMSVRHARRARALYPGVRLVNVYGPTETTTFATTYTVPADLPADAASVPIGRPIADTTCHLLDDHGRPVPDGAVGELHVGGRGVALGYAGRPDLTAERFGPDPFDPSPTAWLYRTGDLCRRLADGNLDFVGRRDRQVKVRGHRVEPGEIEAQLARHPGVARCVVVAAADPAGQTVVTAYYVPHRGAAATAAELVAHLRDRLPAYLVPRSVMAVDHLPVGPSGAVDRAALPAPRLTGAVTPAEPTPAETVPAEPTTAWQWQLLAVWRDVLDAATAGVDDSFFDLGGTSLDAMRLCLLVERATGGQLVPVSALLDHPTVRRFAAAVTPSGPAAAADDAGTGAAAVVVVSLSGTGTGAPVYVIGGDVGHPLELRPLAAALSVDRPVYGLQLPGLDEASAPADTVEAAAAHLLPAVRRLSRGRPAHLVGYCYGGLVAYELARQLRAADAAVGRIVLVDAWTAASRVPKPLHRRVVNRCQYHLRHGTAAAVRRVQDATLRRRPDTDGRLARLVRAVQAASAAAFDRYAPGPYPGQVVSVRAAADDYTDQRTSPGSGGWDAATGRPVPTHLAPGNHTTMLRPPHVAALARLVEAELLGAE